MKSKVSVAILAAALLAGSGANAAIYFTSLVSFNGTNGANPSGRLLQAADGNFYGTAPFGGASNNGTIFRLSPDTLAWTNLYDFGGGVDGSAPSAGLAQGADGWLYGSAYSGGPSNAGTLFRISTAGALQVLNTFSVTNGANPESPMIQTAGGHFWGSTEYGGAIPGANQGGNGFGVLFNLETNGALVDRFDFGKTNGSSPNELLLGQDGNYYGTTTWGGNTSFYVYGFGTIFKLTPDGALSTLYTFSGFADGGFLYAGLAQAADGYLYGATFSGGSYGYGTLFRISTNGQFSTIYNFTGGSDGANPAATLLVGPDGNLYGTTYNGGYGYGSVFQFTPSGNGSTLVLFTGMTGGFPGSRSQTPLVLGSDGNLYGATVYGGPSNQGTLFRVSTPFPPAWQSITQTNGIVTLSWNAILTQTYQVQYINDLAPSGWSVLGGNILATNANMSVPDAMGSNTRRFYRLGILP